MNKIGIVITTFERRELLHECVYSILNNWQPCFNLIIVDQSKDSSMNCLKTNANKHQAENIEYFDVPFDSGLSYCRNYGVQKAKELGCDYVLIGSDSFLFNKSIKKLHHVIWDMENEYNKNQDIVGFELENCVCDWEAKLKLIEGKSFELDFIDKTESQDYYDVDIVRNFFIAKIEPLLDVKWDENLKLAEHEDFFWRFKQAGYRVGWTDFIYAEKMTDRPNKYSDFRKKNFRNGQRYLREKWGISGWVNYINLERAKRK